MKTVNSHARLLKPIVSPVQHMGRLFTGREQRAPSQPGRAIIVFFITLHHYTCAERSNCSVPESTGGNAKT